MQAQEEGGIRVKKTYGAYTVSALGAIIMLVSLAIPWYAIRIGRYHSDLDISELFDTNQADSPEFAGSALPILIMIIFASIVILSALYASIIKSRHIGTLWGWLGFLSVVCIVANAWYMLDWIHEAPELYGDEEIGNILNAGPFIAFLGALIVIAGAIASEVGGEEELEYSETMEQSTGRDNSEYNLHTNHEVEEPSALSVKPIRTFADDPINAAFDNYICRQCGKEVSGEWSFCPYCGGKPLVTKEYRCPNCGVEVNEDWKVCPKCGRDLSIVDWGPKFCPLCGKTIPADATACPYCGIGLNINSPEA